MKLLNTRVKLSGLAIFCLFAAISLAGCEEKKTDDPTPPSNLQSTGLNGTDNVNTIPKTISLGSNFFTPTTLPPAVDLTKYLPPVGNQGSYGTCVAWAVAYNCKTALEAVKFGLTPAQLANPQFQLSPKDLFYNIADRDKGAANCDGSNFVPALDVVLNRGVATNAIAPYTGLNNCSQANSDPAWAADAAKHKIERYRRIDFTTAALKQELAANNPVVLGAKLADNFMSWSTDAVYQNWSSFDQVGRDALHAMCVVGYDDAKGPNGAFKVVNSWGATWASAGFIWVDYRFMMAGGTTGFCFNNNLFVAANDNQKPAPDPNPGPNPNPNPNPNLSGADIQPWVFSDERYTIDGPTRRYMKYEMYNIGTKPVPATTKWGWAYVYYNAYDANDYGVVFYNTLDPATPKNATTFICNDIGCRLNVDLDPDDGVAAHLTNNYTGEAFLQQWYDMPATLTGYYYLVMVADPANKLNDPEANNLFYVTDQDPIYFSNGQGGRRSEAAGSYAFSNTLARNAHKTPEAARYQTAVRPGNLNAYTPTEIVNLLKDRAATGNLAQKISQAKAASHTQAYAK